jgi:hypothetical protein
MVTFPLLAGARVQSVKENGFRSRPVSLARTRAEDQWGRLCGQGGNAARVVPISPRVVRPEARYAARI